jgi:hypothetical protein
LIQDTITNTFTLEQESRSNKLPGAEKFLDSFIEIQTQRFKDIPNETPIKQIYFEDIEKQAKNIETTLFFPEKTKYLLPYNGLCSEVNIFDAINALDGDIQVASLTEDREEGFDFYINGYPVDVTSSPKIEDFKKKWAHGKFAAIYIPLSTFEDSIPFFYSTFTDSKDTYSYQSIYFDNLDHRKLLSRTIDINWKILKELYNYLEGNPTQFKEEELNHISQSFIHNTFTILQYLSELIGRDLSPLDNP